MPFSQGTDIIVSSFQSVWVDFFSAIPSIIAAIIVFALGWAIAVGLGKIIEQAVVQLKLDEGLAKFTGLQEALGRAGLTLNAAKFIGGLIKWFLVIVFLLAAANILQLQGVTDFLKQILLYIPNLIVAAVMMIAAILLAGFFEKLVHASVEAAKLDIGKALGTVTRWAVLIFGFLAAVQQLGVAKDIINIVVTGLVAMVALAGGIAFGIAGKDVAGELLKKAKKNLSGEA